MTRSPLFQRRLAVPLGFAALAIFALEEKLADAPALERSSMQAQIARHDALAVQRQAWAPILPSDGKIHIATRKASDGNGWSFKACDICARRPEPPGVNPRDFTLAPTRVRITPDRPSDFYYDSYQDLWRPVSVSVTPRDLTRTRIRNEMSEAVGYYYNPYEGPHARPVPPGTLPSLRDDYQPPDYIANRWPWIGVDLATHDGMRTDYGGLAGRSWAPR